MRHSWLATLHAVVIWLLPVAYLSLIYGLSGTAASGLPSVRLFPHADKVFHAGLYAGLFVCWLPLCHRKQLLWAAIIACLCAAVADEWHQSQVPGRTPDSADVAADMVGLDILEPFD